MPRQARLNSPAGLYHVILRGNNRANFLLLVISSVPPLAAGFCCAPHNICQSGIILEMEIPSMPY